MSRKYFIDNHLKSCLFIEVDDVWITRKKGGGSILPVCQIKSVFRRSSRFEQGLHRCFYRLSKILSFTACLGISKNEIITKIAPILFNNPFCLKLTTLIIGPHCMEDAIKAAVQVRSAKGTVLPPAHRSPDFQTL